MKFQTEIENLTEYVMKTANKREKIIAESPEEFKQSIEMMKKKGALDKLSFRIPGTKINGIQLFDRVYIKTDGTILDTTDISNQITYKSDEAASLFGIAKCSQSLIDALERTRDEFLALDRTDIGAAARKLRSKNKVNHPIYTPTPDPR